MTNRIAALALTSVLLVAAAACGDTGGVDPAAAPGSTNPPASTPTVPPSTSAPTTAAPTTTIAAPPTTIAAPPTSTTTPAVPTTSTTAPGLPGEPWDHGPSAGELLGVIGVAHDDRLNVRTGPGTGHSVVASLDPLTVGVVATGQARLLPGPSIWLEVTSGGTTGWAAGAYLSRQADTVDSTAAIVDLLGSRPFAPTMAELGQLVADAVAAIDPAARVVVVLAPRGEHDLGEIVIDVIGYGDDSVSGSRLHVFGQPTDSRDAFSLMSVEETLFCYRGVTPDGWCA